MRLEAKKYLFDIRQAVAEIGAFTRGKTFADYSSDSMLRAAVERKLEIVGEAVSQLCKIDESIASQILEYRRIISFRNILIHGYVDVDDALVWDVVDAKLQAPLAQFG